jgi:hypothetical protein
MLRLPLAPAWAASRDSIQVSLIAIDAPVKRVTGDSCFVTIDASCGDFETSIMALGDRGGNLR